MNVKWVLNMREKLNEKHSTVPLIEIVFPVHSLNQHQWRLIENENSVPDCELYRAIISPKSTLRRLMGKPLIEAFLLREWGRVHEKSIW